MSLKSWIIFIVAFLFDLAVIAASIGAGLFGFGLMGLGGDGLLFLGLGLAGMAFAVVFTARVVIPFGRLAAEKG